MQNVVGETVSEGSLIKAAMENLYDLEKSLNAVLSQAFGRCLKKSCISKA